MLKVFIAYVFLAQGNTVVGTMHVTDQYPDYATCMAALSKESDEWKAAAKESNAIPIPKCIDIDIPQELKTSD